MKKLAVLLMALVLLLCAAAQAEVELVDLSNTYVHEDGGRKWIEMATSQDIVLTGETEYPVIIHCDNGTITLRDVYIDSDDVGLWIDASMPCDLDSAEASETVVVNLEGENTVRSSSEAPAMYSTLPLEIRGNGQLSIEAEESFAGLATFEGSLTVSGGRVKILCRGEDGCAYMNGSAAAEGWVYGKVNPGSGYVILAGNDPENAKLTDANRGEAYLEITSDYLPVVPEAEPALPETGDGANLVLWTLMLAASVLGVLSMRRKAREC